MSRLLYRDALMLVVDKPAGIAVHPGPGRGPSLSSALDGLRFGLPRRPEAAHRLDRDTTGCLVLGRHRAALARLGRLFATGAVDKVYWAMVAGSPPDDAGEIDRPLSEQSARGPSLRVAIDDRGKPALTRWRVLARACGQTWLELRPMSGRTHQLRVHCAAMGWPIVGDHIYGTAFGRRGSTLCLHARSVTVPLYPRKPPIAVTAPVPDALREVMAKAGFRPEEEPPPQAARSSRPS